MISPDTSQTRVLAIVGPTAVGKTALAEELAVRLSGEIVSADAMQVYRGADIGTGKPTQAERAEIPHGGLDLVDFVGQYTLDNPTIMGLSNVPVPRDEKRTQVELGTIAMKKVIDFDVNYYQIRVADVARQLILSAVPNVVFGP